MKFILRGIQQYFLILTGTTTPETQNQVGQSSSAHLPLLSHALYFIMNNKRFKHIDMKFMLSLLFYCSTGREGDLRVYLKGLAKAENVQKLFKLSICVYTIFKKIIDPCFSKLDERVSEPSDALSVGIIFHILYIYIYILE